MSLHPMPWPEPAEEITRAVLAMYGGRRAPLPVVVRDELGELFADAEFAEAFADRVPQGWSPGRLMLITVFQAAENLTDRQAAEAVRDKISWKYALGLGLDDAGFDFTILTEFRTRLVQHDMLTRVLDLLVARLVDKGLLKAGGKQRTDSTHVIAAVRLLHQIELVGESVRACVEALAVADPDWVTARLATPLRRAGRLVADARLEDQTRRAGRRLRPRRGRPATRGMGSGHAAGVGPAARGRGVATGPDPERGDHRRSGWAGGDAFAGGRHGRAPRLVDRGSSPRTTPMLAGAVNET